MRQVSSHFSVQFEFSRDEWRPDDFFGIAGSFFRALDKLDQLLENLLGVSGESRELLVDMDVGRLLFEREHTLRLPLQNELGEPSRESEITDLCRQLGAAFFRTIADVSGFTEPASLDELKQSLEKILHAGHSLLVFPSFRVSPESLLLLLEELAAVGSRLDQDKALTLTFPGEDEIFIKPFPLDAETLRADLIRSSFSLHHKGVLEVERIPHTDMRGRLKGRFFFRYGQQLISCLPASVPHGESLKEGDLVSVALTETVYTPEGKASSSHIEIQNLRVIGGGHTPVQMDLPFG